jgi:excinuclease UvrABC nuclease subunit
MKVRNTKQFVHSREYINTFPDKPGAYLLVSPKEEQMYVGVTCNIRTRIRQHLRSKRSKFLDFTAKVLEISKTTDPTYLDELEQKYINIYKPTLNNPKASKYSTRPCK